MAGSKTPEWYFFKASARERQQVGPFSWEQLRSLAQAGTLLPVDLVWNPGVSQWLLAGQIEGIFPEGSPGEQGRSPGTTQPAAPSTGRGRGWLPWLAPLAALIIVGGGLGVYFGFFRDGRESTASGQTTTTLEVTTTSVTATTASEATTTTEAPAAWANLNPGGAVPAPRYGHSMVYDSAAGKAILFGGWDENASVDLGDTWAYDRATNTWAQLSPVGASPSARCRFAMTYDKARGKVILFGGYEDPTDRCLSDTWSLDLATQTWTDLSPAGPVPSARGWTQMVYDETNGKVILFGGWGEDAGVDLNDTWAYDPVANAWTELHPAGDTPSPREPCPLVYDPASGRVILFGGTNDSTDNCTDDTWSFDLATQTWTNLNPNGPGPYARGWSSMVYDSVAGKVILFGGWGGSILDDTWAYDPAANEWAELTAVGTTPSARSSHCMVYDSAASEVVLFGGSSATDSPFGDTWAFGSAR